MRVTEELKNEIKNLYMQGISMYKIGNKVGLSIPTVKSVLISNGFNVHDRFYFARERKRKIYDIITRNLDKLRTGEITTSDLAKLCNVSVVTMRVYLRAYLNTHNIRASLKFLNMSKENGLL